MAVQVVHYSFRRSKLISFVGVIFRTLYSIGPAGIVVVEKVHEGLGFEGWVLLVDLV